VITRDDKVLRKYYQCCKCRRYYCLECRPDLTIVNRLMTKEEELGFRLRGEQLTWDYCKTCSKD
jgi:hypothetical protein